MYELEILHQCGKRVNTKSQKVFGANFYICRSYREKNWQGGLFVHPHPSWIGLRRVQKRIRQLTDQYLYYHFYLKFLEELFLITQKNLSYNKILYDYQSGFRKNNSTDTCLSCQMQNFKRFRWWATDWYDLDDVQKAFDTINHDIFLNKLSIIGFSNHTVK